MSTIHELVAGARRRLHEAGIPDDEADLDARLLAERVLGWDTTQYFTEGGSPALGSFVRRYEIAVGRRARREPVAYITGTQEFWGLSFTVNPAVLIPRPETELIVEIVLDKLSNRSASVRIADACTGSGCLAVVLARELPAARIVATDLSKAALDVAAANARQHAVADRISFEETDILSDVPGSFDIIVSNPPYVPEAELATLQPEVMQYEPRLALAGGHDGLDVVRGLVDQAASKLRETGWLVFEFGFGQADAIGPLVERAGLGLEAIRSDLQGIPRTAVALRRGRVA